MEIKLGSVEDAPYLSRYYSENSEHLRSWEPIREPGYNDLGAWVSRLEGWEVEQKEKRAAYFMAYSNVSKEVMAVCNLTGVSKGVFQACFMGYSVAKQYEGKGVMKVLCQHAITYAFESMALNRIMANHMPDNIRSEYLLKSLGFEVEGLAKKYLCINGKWEDHVLNAIINPSSR